MSACVRCGDGDHCACWHGACCSCGSKDHGSCGPHPQFDPAVEHHDEGWCVVCGHFARQHSCCWIVELEQCGLWCGHDGEHVPFVPGDYLSEPTVHPLDVLRLERSRWPWRNLRCPLCRGKLDRWCAGPRGTVSRAVDGGWHLSTETPWRFSPCGCEAREILEELR